MKTPIRKEDGRTLQVLRIVSLFAAFLYLAFGFFLEYGIGLDDPIPYTHRVLIAAIFSGVTVLSYTSSLVRRHLAVLTYAIACGAVIHVLLVGTQTRFDAGSVVALLLAVPFLNFLFYQWKFLLWLNTALFFIIAGAFVSSSPDIVRTLLFLIFSTAIIGVSFWFTNRLRSIEAAAAKNEQLLQDLFRFSMEGIAIHELITDDNGKPVDYVFLKVNPAFEKHTGLKSRDVLGKHVTAVLPDIVLTPFIATFGRVVQTGEAAWFEQFFEPLQRHYQISAYPMEGSRFAAVFNDVTEYKAMDQERIRIATEYETVFQSTQDVLFLMEVVSSETFRYIRTNAAHAQATGIDSSQIQGKTPQELFDAETSALINARYQLCLRQRKTTSFEETLSLTGGTQVWSTVLTPVIEDGEIAFIVGSSRDITEQKRAMEAIEYLSFHDELTGLHNRRFYETELQRLNVPENFPLAIIIADVNGLKLINDAFGHGAGDALLKATAEVLKKTCRKQDLAARIGGDEFAVLLPAIDKEQLRQLTERLRQAVSMETVQGLPISIACGSAMKTNPEEKLEDVFKLAEDRMYSEKVSDRNSHRHQTIQLIMQTLYAKSQRERRHSERVGHLCGVIGAAMGFNRRELDQMIAGGELHDIGKIAIDNELLDKDRPLSDADWEQIKRHPQVGHSILSAIDDYGPLARGVLAHHERWDGSGYPHGLKGDEIPLSARVIAIADTYDAMTRGRPYRRGKSREEAVAEIRACAGSQFDPDVVEVFLKTTQK